jgi:hypothetical protein
MAEKIFKDIFLRARAKYNIAKTTTMLVAGLIRQNIMLFIINLAQPRA